MRILLLFLIVMVFSGCVANKDATQVLCCTEMKSGFTPENYKLVSDKRIAAEIRRQSLWINANKTQLDHDKLIEILEIVLERNLHETIPVLLENIGFRGEYCDSRLGRFPAKFSIIKFANKSIPKIIERIKLECINYNMVSSEFRIREYVTCMYFIKRNSKMVEEIVHDLILSAKTKHEFLAFKRLDRIFRDGYLNISISIKEMEQLCPDLDDNQILKEFLLYSDFKYLWEEYYKNHNYSNQGNR